MEDDEERGNLDFVVLELGPNTEGKFPGDVYRPQCLSLAEPQRDDPLYVIGHPLGDPRTVHDNTFVYFPHRVTPEEYAELKMLVSQEFDSIAAEDASYNDGKLKEFRDSYQLRENGGDPWYEYVSVRFGQTADHRRGQRHVSRQFRIAGVQPPHARRDRTAVRRAGRPDAGVGTRMALARSGAADHARRRAARRGDAAMAHRSQELREAGNLSDESFDAAFDRPSRSGCAACQRTAPAPVPAPATRAPAATAPAPRATRRATSSNSPRASRPIACVKPPRKIFKSVVSIEPLFPDVSPTDDPEGLSRIHRVRVADPPSPAATDWDRRTHCAIAAVSRVSNPTSDDTIVEAQKRAAVAGCAWDHGVATPGDHAWSLDKMKVRQARALVPPPAEAPAAKACASAIPIPAGPTTSTSTAAASTAPRR